MAIGELVSLEPQRTCAWYSDSSYTWPCSDITSKIVSAVVAVLKVKNAHYFSLFRLGISSVPFAFTVCKYVDSVDLITNETAFHTTVLFYYGFKFFVDKILC